MVKTVRAGDGSAVYMAVKAWAMLFVVSAVCDCHGGLQQRGAAALIEPGCAAGWFLPRAAVYCIRQSHVDKHLTCSSLTCAAGMDDVSALLIKLADRLHNMRTISVLSRCKQVRMASETLDVFAVLANRLGAWAIKAELEDLSFKTLNPEEYELVSQAVAARTAAAAAAEPADGTKGLTAGIDQLTAALAGAGLEVVDVSGRVKNVYGVWKKIQKQLQGSSRTRGISDNSCTSGSYDEPLQDQDPSSSTDLSGSPPQRLSPAAAAVAGVSNSGSSEERAAAVADAVARVYDIQALRVVVPHKHDCYAAMRVVQEMWTAMPGRLKDYIRQRKANGYQVSVW